MQVLSVESAELEDVRTQMWQHALDARHPISSELLIHGVEKVYATGVRRNHVSGDVKEGDALSEPASTSADNYWETYKTCCDQVSAKEFVSSTLSEQVLNKLPTRKKMIIAIEGFAQAMHSLYECLLCCACTTNSTVQALHPDRIWTSEKRKGLCV